MMPLLMAIAIDLPKIAIVPIVESFLKGISK